MKKWIFLLRAFFPSWRFFEDVGPELSLELRSGLSPDLLGEWHNALPPIARSWKNIVINPNGNFLHACHNLLNHLATEIQTHDRIGDRAAYKLVRNLACMQTPDVDSHYQFRLVADGHEHVLISPVYSR